MLSQIRAALAILAALTVLTGLAYPLAVTAAAQAAFPDKANGSMIRKDGKVLGSTLIGQSFDEPKYFWGRLSATTDADGKPLAYNAGASAASNLGPTNPALVEQIQSRIAALHAADPESSALPVPVDIVTTSGSGLDPDISPAAAEYQVRRVAKARGLDDERVRRLVSEHTEDRQLGFLGEPRVNVLELNLALDRL